MKKFVITIAIAIVITIATTTGHAAVAVVKLAAAMVGGGVIVKAMTPDAPAVKTPVATATNAPATVKVETPVATATNAPAATVKVVEDPVTRRAELLERLESTSNTSGPLFGSLGGSSGGSSNPSTLREEQEGPQRVLAARGFLATQAGGKVTAALAAVNVSDRLLRQVLVENYSSTTLKGWCDPKGGISAGELAVLRKQLAAASLHTINMVW